MALRLPVALQLPSELVETRPSSAPGNKGIPQQQVQAATTSDSINLEMVLNQEQNSLWLLAKKEHKEHKFQVLSWHHTPWSATLNCNIVMSRYSMETFMHHKMQRNQHLLNMLGKQGSIATLQHGINDTLGRCTVFHQQKPQHPFCSSENWSDLPWEVALYSMLTGFLPLQVRVTLWP